MGVRFACHACGKQLNIKQDLAGRRGVCPNCSERFRIPMQDTAQSTPVEAVAARRSPIPKNGNAVSSPVNSSTKSVVAAAPTAGASVASIELLVGDPDATWYVRPPTGGQYGPANGDVLRQWIDEGRVAATALLWRDGWPQWREASEALPELTAKPSTATAQAKSSQTVVETPQPAPASGKNSSANGESVEEETESFGYEDSDFARNTAYTSVSSEPAKLTGRNDVGAQRRNRSNRKTLSIVFLGIMILLLIAAITYLITR